MFIAREPLERFAAGAGGFGVGVIDMALLRSACFSGACVL